MKKFWKWKNGVKKQNEEEVTERILFLNGTIAEESWFDDDVTPQIFKDELNKGEMEKAIDMLDEVKESIINAYEIKTGLSRAKLSHLMDSETWMDANKAVELGFADDILKRSEANDMEVPQVSMMYQEAQVVNSLMDKLATKCKIENKETNKGIKADELMNRLFLMRNWR